MVRDYIILELLLMKLKMQPRESVSGLTTRVLKDVHSVEAIDTMNLCREIILLLRKSYRHVTARSLGKNG